MALTAGKLYRQTVSAHWLAYGLGTLTLLATSLTEVLVPRFVQWALDVIAGKGDGVPRALARATPAATLDAIAGWFVVALVVAWIGRFGWRQLLARQTHVAGRDLKVRLWDVLRDLPLRTFHRYPLGDLMNRATGDWSASRAIHGFTVVLTLDMIFFTVLAVGSMLMISAELTVYCLLVFPFLPRFVLRLARREHDQHLDAQVKLGQLSDAISQSLGSIRLQRATASDGPWQSSLASEARAYAELRRKVVRTGWRIFPLGALPTLIAYGILLLIGVRQIMHGEISIGEFVALQSYVLMLQGPLLDMGDCISEWQRGIASLKRIVEIFNLGPQEAARVGSAGLRPAACGDSVVEVRGLTFAYEPGQPPVLRDVALAARAGETLGICGPIGGGKSTLLKLVTGLLEPPRGTLRLAGVEARDLARDWVARHVTMVPQRAFLFAGSIRSNLELDAALSDDELWAALALVRLDADVRRLEGGLDAWVGEWGINLSGGQKQRLSLARALLRRRELILLDDCLSAVDAVTEEMILRGMRDWLGGSAVIWVAHRMSTLRLCDRVYELERGVLRLARGEGRTVMLEDAGQ